MKINPEDYLRIEDLAAALGTNKRGAQRVLARAAEAGFNPREKIFGRVVIHRRHLPALAKYHYPRGSERAAAQARESGSRGGAAKGASYRLKRAFLAAVAASEPRAGSDTAGTGDAAPRSRSPRRARRAPSG